MNPEALAYPFLFIALFFESFVLVTFLSKPARSARARQAASIEDPSLPTVAIVVPCWNEETTVAGTVESLLALKYPKEKLEIILVDDGSTDGTPAAMARFADNAQVQIVRKENGGKHTAMNAGTALTSAEIVGYLDADSFVEPSALLEVMSGFTSEQVAAVTAAMSVHKPDNLLRHMQNAEYIFGITLRHTLASVNGLYVTPGPFSFFRREIIVALGGFREAHKGEDLEMALRLQRAGYWLENAPRAKVYTKGPPTLRKLLKQRVRWTTGFMRNVGGEYRDLVGNRRYGALGMLVLPLNLTTYVSGTLMFLLALFLLGRRAFAAIEIRSGIPASYAWLPHASALSRTFDWFYLPSSLYILLGVATIIGSLTMIAIGKRVSETPGSLVQGLLAYLIAYGFIAPLWVMRSLADIALGKKRAWR
ncbi:MAG: glycosyltransferase family 2 protein [Patescibacteria group bacterium]|nr:glycosyltransferase family 2 protein [Patescibacteria group bacterium]MDE1943981.1 glycosyltransferase family 2 protein [Patescibacteria group bacterium]MDE1944690.1 glycosyltransferase family 2 protein [Patescibacteria group bacterium]MDE2057376.1 glycosyltransferase family 2 protein [Patescibacteria group bacterium]